MQLQKQISLQLSNLQYMFIFHTKLLLSCADCDDIPYHESIFYLRVFISKDDADAIVTISDIVSFKFISAYVIEKSRIL